MIKGNIPFTIGKKLQLGSVSRNKIPKILLTLNGKTVEHTPIDTKPIAGSRNPITSGAVHEALKNVSRSSGFASTGNQPSIPTWGSTMVSGNYTNRELEIRSSDSAHNAKIRTSATTGNLELEVETDKHVESNGDIVAFGDGSAPASSWWDGLASIVDNTTIQYTNGQLVVIGGGGGGDPDWGDITNKPSVFPPETHGHAWGEITGKPSVFPPETHGHAWGEITGKPSTFPPSSHTHSQYVENTGDVMTGALRIDGNYLWVKNKSDAGVLLRSTNDESGPGANIQTNVNGDIVLSTRSTSNNERVRIREADGAMTMDGNLGIGTIPQTPIHIHKNGEALRLQSTETGNTVFTYLSFHDNASDRQGFVGYGSTANNNLYINNDEAAGILLKTNGNEAALTSDGKLTIGTTNPPELRENTAYTYGSLLVGGSKGGYVGVVLGGANRTTLMESSTGTQGGIYCQGGTEWWLHATKNGSVNLRHNNSVKIATATDGIDVTGELRASGDVIA
jgi:hypothetical protein